jgi:hypothetical protein
MPEVLRDFMARATAVVNMAKTFPSLSIDELGVTVSSLRNTLAPKKLEDVSELVGAFVPDRAIGKPDDERKELRLLSHGTSSLGASFADAEGLDLLSTAARLRDRANRRGGTEAEKEARYTSLLDRMSAVSKDKPDITDALEQVEQEDDAVP